jgi:hypothetical protein
VQAVFRLRGENQNPAEIGQHDETCRDCDKNEANCTGEQTGHEYDPVCTGADFISDDGKRVLSDETELPEDFHDCGACSYSWQLAHEIVEATGDIEWLDRALAAFALEGTLQDWKDELRLSDLSAAQMIAVSIVKEQRRMVTAQQEYVASQHQQQHPGSRRSIEDD